MIEHANIIYMPTISELGGIETWVYEMVKKYKNYDIAVVSKRCDETQAKRIRQYCRLYIYNNEQIKCKVALINYDQSIIDYIDMEADIYQVIHADYTNTAIYDHRPKPHPRIKAFIAITKFLQDGMRDLLKPNDVILSRNPLTIDDEKPLIFVSATRLHKHKGVQRMQKMIDEMDRAGISYLWYVITGDIGCLSGKNVIFIQNRLDISKFLSQATYVALLSDSEACSYTLSEALYRNIPIITTPLPYLEEMGYKDGVNGYTIEFDCSNIKAVVEKIKNVPKFTFKRLEDGYDKILSHDKSKYEEDKIKNILVKPIMRYFDLEENEWKDTDSEPWLVNKMRADKLVFKKRVKIVDNP